MTTAGPEPGWYFDPDGRENERYWNGIEWTEHRRSKPSTVNPPPHVVPETRTHPGNDERLPLQDGANAEGDAGFGTHLENLAAAADRLGAACAELDEAKAIAKRAAVQAHDNGTFETVITKSLGVSRMTVRRWLGKQ